MLITKALIEIPPKFAGQPPVHPDAKGKMTGAGMWKGARGLADDVRYYGQWMRDRAFERIGYLYPKAKLPKEHGGGQATVIAWLWARTVQCPNPACGAQMPLTRSFALSAKPEKKVWLEPSLTMKPGRLRFEIRTGEPARTRVAIEGTAAARSKCFVRAVGRLSRRSAYRESKVHAGRMERQLLAIVAEGPRRPSLSRAQATTHAAFQCRCIAEAGHLSTTYSKMPRSSACIPYGT